MNIQDVLDALKNGEAVVIRGKTFEPETYQDVELETGETVTWVRDGRSMWVSVDPSAEECILFHDIDEELEVDGDVVMYAGKDYELTLELEGKVMEDDEEVDQVTIMEYEGDSGEVLFACEYNVSGDVQFALGNNIPEDELQEV